MSSSDDTRDDQPGDVGDSKARETPGQTSQRERATRRQGSSRAGTWGAGVILILGLWIIVAAFFWGDPVADEDVIARGLASPAVSEASGEVVAVSAAAIEGTSTLYWSNIVVGVIIVIIALIVLAAATGFMSDSSSS